MDRAPLSDAEAVELQQWLAGDPRRRGAYVRAQAIWMRSESARALGPQYDPTNFQPVVAPTPPVKRRRSFVSWSGALAASLVIVVMLVASLQIPTAYATAKGEMRAVPLGDGSTVTLNTATRIKVYEDEGRRRIRVLYGEVLIEAGTNATTLVEVGDKQVEASAATFVVRKLDGQPAQVLVQEGRVVLAEETPSASLPLAANTSASLLEGEAQGWQLQALSLGQLGRELAWREGKIALQGETLAEAVALYARYSDTAIVISDPELAQTQVTGLFAVNNPLGFSHAVADVFDAEVRHEDDRIVIARRR
ncbi:FecR domain-containing protein [Steroidobacter sp. S1-65]|uniref:FecR domain-containing protein n=2 Tax=Steroidobacter gossypii TaxID=2805490 RepID=A0ABS1WV12_9GAMM|nr:FecR domain-containing protein [Steroidobacter gossypii]